MNLFRSLPKKQTLSCVFFFFAFISQSQTVKNFTISNGLPGNSITCLFKDSKGLLWVATETGLCFYDGTYFKIDNTVIYGFTAWTKSIFNSKTIAQQYLNDYNRIKTTKGAITPGFINELSTHEINQFREFTEKVNNGEIECENVIVVTHFPPISSNTSSPEYENGILSGYYSWTNLLKYEDVKCDKIKIWCSGHTHWSYDFKKSGVRYLSNQIGYPGENIAFNADLVFTL